MRKFLAVLSVVLLIGVFSCTPEDKQKDEVLTDKTDSVNSGGGGSNGGDNGED